MNTVIFDMDGVLLNSEPIYLALNREFYKSIGADISMEEYQTFIGMSGPLMWNHIITKHNLPHTIEQLKEYDLAFKFEALQKAALCPTEGALEFLQYLKQKKYNTAIASSGRKKNIDLILHKLNFTQYFDAIISGGQVENGKPAPDIFLKAASCFNSAANECAVIEDSYNGVCGARAANMFCVGYYNPGSGVQDLSKADIVIDSFNDKRLYEIF